MQFTSGMSKGRHRFWLPTVTRTVTVRFEISVDARKVSSTLNRARQARGGGTTTEVSHSTGASLRASSSTIPERARQLGKIEGVCFL